MAWDERSEKFRLGPVRNEPGYEGSDQAIAHAHQIVVAAASELRADWMIDGITSLAEWITIHPTLKCTDDDFVFLGSVVGELWDTFRYFELSLEKQGDWTSTVKSNLGKVLSNKFSNFPDGYKPSSLQSQQIADLSILSLDRCLQEDKEILGNAVFEIVMLIWCHYLRSGKQL
jgi:hypothetical protein